MNHPLRGQTGPEARSRSETQSVSFNRDVRPILSDRCYFCHGPDPSHREAGLRLDSREAALEYGALDEDDPAASLLLERIDSTDPDWIMPPPDSHKSLTDAERAVLREWVLEGAPYEVHWAYAPLTRPEVPGQATRKAHSDGTATSNPIDAFVRRRLEWELSEIEPAPPAPPNILLRRLCLDLLGVPPSAEQMTAWMPLARDPNRWEELVDTVLDQPEFGERMATPWLDLVRYSDTVGYHGDQNQNAWAYRDWVIDAFNHNMPFDQFTIEQLAGDLLDDPTPQQLTATCFNRLNMMTREGGAQPGEYLAIYAADRVRTTGMAWLGSTVGCAECHDHKYDPITTRDFYSLSAFFADVKQWGVYHDYAYTPNPDLRGWSNDHPFPPEITVTSRFLQQRLDQYQRELLQVTVSEVVPADRPSDESFPEPWRQELGQFLDAHPEGWQTLKPLPHPEPEKNDSESKALESVPESAASQDATSTWTIEAEGVIDLGSAPPAMLEFAIPNDIATVTIELLPGTETGSFRSDGKDGSISLTPRFFLKAPGAEELEPIAVRRAEAEPNAPRYANGFALTGIPRGWRTVGATEPHRGSWVLARPLKADGGKRLIVDLQDKQAVGRLRVAGSPLVPESPDKPFSVPVVDIRAALNQLEQGSVPNDELLAKLSYQFVRTGGQHADLQPELDRIEQQIVACRGGQTPVMVTESVAPAETRILPRGDWQDQSGDRVLPATPGFLPDSISSTPDQRLTRLDLAHWLISDTNPLTARVVVNRYWRMLFGEGLSSRTDDLGAQGSPPSHPELLDWLACEFRESGWNTKHVLRLIVTSETWKRSSRATPAMVTADPDNRLLARQNPRRLPAEMVRDNALAIAGLLHREVGGPPVKPFQPPGYYANLQFPNRRYQTSPAPDRYRRGVYMHWQRTFLHPMLANFDAPSREDCLAMRNEANNPQQALTLLNDPVFVEAALTMASRSEETDDARRIETLWQRALLRPPEPHELQSLLEFLAAMRSAYAGDAESARQLVEARLNEDDDTAAIELAAWTHVCRVILNLHETITRY